MAIMILFNKPFGVLSQFTDESGRATLADFITIKNVYSAGRLDKDSEGLLLLTDDGKLQNKVSQPRNKMAKHYWVQIEGEIDDYQLQQLQHGVKLKDGITAPAEVWRISEPPSLWSRNPPIRSRKSIPTQWLEFVLYEGKNRQIRRMTAAVGCPTLRLIRFQIGPWKLGKLQPGEHKLLNVESMKIDTIMRSSIV